MIRKLSTTCVLLLCAVFSVTGHAHKRWLLPTDFALSDAEVVTVDFTASNNIFYVDKGMPLKGVSVLSPGGKALPISNTMEGERRSSFDVKIEEAGTHRFVVQGDPVYFLSYTLPGVTKPHYERGPLEWLKKQVPEEATNVGFSESTALIETYVTLGAPSEVAALAESKGISLQLVSHPNELYSDEDAEFVVLLHGKPVAGQTVTIVPEGTRYRDSQSESQFITDSGGMVQVAWQGPGRYLVEIAMEQPGQGREIAAYYYNYFLSLEVLAP